MPAEKISYNDSLRRGTDKLNNVVDIANKVEIDSAAALDKSTTALSNSESTQEQLDTLIIESGTSDVEVLQARTDENGTIFPLLKDHLNNKGKKIEVLQKNYISVFSYEDLKVAIAQGYDWTPAAQQACNDAADGAVIIFPYGEDYHLNNVNHTGKTLHFLGYGAKAIQIANSPTFNLKGGYEQVTTISSITIASYDFSGQSQSHPVTKITTTTTMTLKPGDVVKIVSNDEIEGAKTGTATNKRRRGEYAIVGAISGTEIHLTTLLRETYTTSPRIAKLKDVTYSLRGFNFDTLDSGDGAGWNASMITVKAAKDCVFYDLECLKGYSSFLTLVGLYGYSVDRVHVKNLKNDPSALRFGYGINDISCENGKVSGYLVINVRHGYTTNTNAIPEGSSDLESFGRSANTNVSGFSHGASNTGFDTHDEAYNIRFVDCYSNGSYRGKDATGAGFSARGRRVSFVNCVAESCRYGFNVFEQHPDSTHAITLENCKSYNTGNYAIYVNTNGSGVDVKGLKVIGGYYEIIRGSRVVDLLNVKDAEFDGCKFAPKVGNSFTRVLNLDNSDVKMKNVKVDATGFTSTNLQIFRLNNASDLVADDIDVEFGSGASPRVLEGDGTANSAIVTNFKGDVNPSIASNITDYYFSSKNSTIPNMTVFQDVTANGQIPNIANNANDVIYLRLRSTTGSWSMGEIPDGFKRGQVLVIRNSGSGANTITIMTGSSYNALLYGAANRVLNNEEAITLIWDNSDWVATGQ